MAKRSKSTNPQRSDEVRELVSELKEFVRAHPIFSLPASPYLLWMLWHIRAET
jgi:hypothetical protein